MTTHTRLKVDAADVMSVELGAEASGDMIAGTVSLRLAVPGTQVVISGSPRQVLAVIDDIADRAAPWRALLAGADSA